MKSISPLLAIALAFAVTGAPGPAAAKDCPPGLAKKSPACVPPGLAKKGVRAHDDDRDHDRDRYSDRDRYRDRDRYTDRDRYRDRDDVYVIGDDGRIYRIGDRLRREDYVLLRRDDFYRLPPLDPGRTYVRVDDQIVEVVAATNLLVRTLGVWSDLLN